MTMFKSQKESSFSIAISERSKTQKTMKHQKQ